MERTQCSCEHCSSELVYATFKSEESGIVGTSMFVCPSCDEMKIEEAISVVGFETLSFVQEYEE